MKLYSMKDIAEEIGKDKSNVYRYIKKNNIAHNDVKERTLLFNATQKNTIIKGMSSNSNDHVAAVAQHDQHNEHHSEADNNAYQIIAAMQDNIKNLKEQNALLAKQLESKDKQLDEAQKLIDQQQLWTINTFRDRLLKIGGRVTKYARKVILTLDSRNQEQFDGLFWRAWERLNALWQ